MYDVCTQKGHTLANNNTFIKMNTIESVGPSPIYVHNICGKRDMLLLLLLLPCIRFNVRSNSFKFDNDIKFNYPVDTMHDMNKKGQSSCHISVIRAIEWLTPSLTQEVLDEKREQAWMKSQWKRSNHIISAFGYFHIYSKYNNGRTSNQGTHTHTYTLLGPVNTFFTLSITRAHAGAHMRAYPFHCIKC